MCDFCDWLKRLTADRGHTQIVTKLWHDGYNEQAPDYVSIDVVRDTESWHGTGETPCAAKEEIDQQLTATGAE